MKMKERYAKEILRQSGLGLSEGKIKEVLQQWIHQDYVIKKDKKDDLLIEIKRHINRSFGHSLQAVEVSLLEEIVKYLESLKND